MNAVTFQAVIYRDLRFDSDGGGRVTLQFDAQQEASVVGLLTMRNRLLEISIRIVEGYGNDRAQGQDK